MSYLFGFPVFLIFFSFSVLFSSIFIHSKLGLDSIIDDYIHDLKIKNKILFLKNLLLVTIYIVVMGGLIKTIYNG